MLERFTESTRKTKLLSLSWSDSIKQLAKRYNLPFLIPSNNNPLVSLQLNELSQTSTKVKNMFELVFDVTKDKEKREKGADNLVVLAREKSGAEMLHKEGAIPQMARLMKVEQNVTIRLSLIRSIGEMCKKSQEIAKSVLKECGIPFFLDILNSNNEEVVNASSYIIQVNFKDISCRNICRFFPLAAKKQKKSAQSLPHSSISRYISHTA